MLKPAVWLQRRVSTIVGMDVICYVLVSNLRGVQYCFISRAVHRFEKQKYTVLEGESINITFRRNVKGITTINRLSL